MSIRFAACAWSVRSQRGREGAHGGPVEGADLPGGDGVRDKPQSRGGRPIVRERREPVDTAELQLGRGLLSVVFCEVSGQPDVPRGHSRGVVAEKERESQSK